MAKLEFLASGKFKQKGDQPRYVRSVRLTDSCWDYLGNVAEIHDLTRADLLEQMTENKLVFKHIFDQHGNENEKAITHITFLIESLYQENELEIPSKDKASTKRAFQKLLEYLS
jgi:predicted DNA-binding ribbon-helix-helix protein